MRKVTVLILFVAAMVVSVAVAWGDEVKLIGTITKIEMADGGAIATLKDNTTGNEVPVSVTDELTLDKFKDHRIVEGDEIRCKYEVENGKNVSKLFRKTAGC